MRRNAETRRAAIESIRAAYDQFDAFGSDGAVEEEDWPLLDFQFGDEIQHAALPRRTEELSNRRERRRDEIAAYQKAEDTKNLEERALEELARKPKLSLADKLALAKASRHLNNQDLAGQHGQMHTSEQGKGHPSNELLGVIYAYMTAHEQPGVAADEIKRMVDNTLGQILL